MTSPNSSNTSIMRRSFKRGKKLFTRFSVDHSHTSNASVEGSWCLYARFHFPRFWVWLLWIWLFVQADIIIKQSNTVSQNLNIDKYIQVNESGLAVPSIKFCNINNELKLGDVQKLCIKGEGDQLGAILCKLFRLEVYIKRGEGVKNLENMQT